MKTRALALCLGGLLLFSRDPRRGTPKHQEIEGAAGTVGYRVKYISTGTIGLKSSIDSIMRTIDNSFSIYNKESIVSKTSKGYVPTKADKRFKKVYIAARKIWKEGGGKYDPTMGLPIKVWRFGREIIQPISKLPTDQGIDGLKQYVGFDKVQIGTDGHVKKEHPAIQMDLSSVVRSYTANVTGDYLQGEGINDYAVKAAGEIKVDGKNIVGGKPWVVSAIDPYELDSNYSEVNLKLANKAASTDEDFRHVWIGGTGGRFVRTIDPSTSKPLESEVLSVTVVTKSARESDSYATIFMLISPEKSKEFLVKYPEIKALIMYSAESSKTGTYIVENIKPLLVENKK